MPSVKDLLVAPSPAPSAPPRSVSDLLGKPSPTAVAAMSGAPAPQAAAVSNEGGRIAYGAEVQGLQHAVYRTSLEDGYPEDVALDASMEAVRKYQAVGPGRNHGDIEEVLTARTNPMTAKKALALAFGPAAIPLPVDAPTPGERDEEYRRAVRARGEASWFDALAETWKGEDAPDQRAEDVAAAGMKKPWLQDEMPTHAKVANAMMGGIPLAADAVAHLLGGDLDMGYETVARAVEGYGEDKDVRNIAGAPHKAATGLLLQSGGPQALAAAARGLGLDDPDTAIGTAIQFVDDATPREDADAALKRYYETGDRSGVDALPWRTLPSRLQANGRPDMGLLVNAVRDGVLKDDPAAEPLRKALAENRTAPAYLAAQAERLPLASLRLVQPDLWPTSADLESAWTARSKALEWSGGKQGDAAVRLMGAGLLRPVGEGGELVFRPSRFAELMRLAGTAPEMIYEADVRSMTRHIPGAAPAGATTLRAMLDNARLPTKAGVEFMVQSGAYDDVLHSLGLEGSDAFAALRDPDSTWSSRVMADLYLPDYQGPGYRAAYERAGGDPESAVAKGLGTADVAIDFLLPAEEIVAGPAVGALTAGLRGKAAMRAAREAGLPARPAWRTTLAAMAPVLEGKTDGIEAVNKRLRHEVFDGLLTGQINPDAIGKQGEERIVGLFREAGVQNPEDAVTDLLDYARDRRARILDETAVVLEKGGPATQKIRESRPYADRRRELEDLVNAGNLAPRDRDLMMRTLEAFAFRALDQGRVASPEEFFARHRWERGVDEDVAAEGLASREGGTTRGSIEGAPRTRADVEASPEFLAWFGDSRVVDGEGKPLVVYHGSRAFGFEEFSRERLGTNTGAPSASEGFFFSGRPETAGSDAYVDTTRTLNTEGATALSATRSYLEQTWAAIRDRALSDPAYASDVAKLRREEIIDADGRLDLDRMRQLWGDDDQGLTDGYAEAAKALDWLAYQVHDDGHFPGYVEFDPDTRSTLAGGWGTDKTVDAARGSGLYDVYLSMGNPLEVDQRGAKYREESYKSIIDRAKSAGHDGVIIRNTYDGGPLDDIYVVFEPTQIKSATGNRGTFDPRDPNILHSEEGGTVQGSIQPDRPTAPAMAEINEGRRRTWGAADPNERTEFLRSMRERTLAALVAGEDVPDEVVASTGLQRDAALLTTGRITVPPGAQDVTPDGPTPAPLAGKTFDAVEWNPPEPGETEGLALLSLGGRQVGSARLAPTRLRREFGHLLGGRIEDAVRVDPGSVAYASVADVRPGRVGTLYSEEGGVVRGAIESAAPAAPRPIVPTFYSALRRAVEGLRGDRFTADQLRATLRNTPGVKAEEIEWTRLDALLAENPRPTKAEVLAWLDENAVVVEERVLGASGGRYGTNPHGDQWSVLDLENDGEEVVRVATEEEAEARAATLNGPPAVGPTHYANYTLPGGENYREVLFKLPAREGRVPAALSAAMDAAWDDFERVARAAGLDPYHAYDGADQLPEYQRFRAAKDAVERVVRANAESSRSYTAPHFAKEGENLLAHARVNDRVGPNGEKILFVEEVQSDAHQAGREKGYRTPEAAQEVDRLQAESDKARRALDEIDNQLAEFSATHSPTDTPPREMLAARRAAHDASTSAYMAVNRARMALNEAVPLAPFAKTWPDLVLKRILRMAAEGGYDGVAWTPGVVQVKRYEDATRAAVDEIRWERATAPRVEVVETDNWGAPGYAVEVNGKFHDFQNVWSADRETVEATAADLLEEMTADAPPPGTVEVVGIKDGREVYRDTLPAEKLPGLLGKGMATNIVGAPEASGVFKGADLTIGGEGMRTFYDVMLRNTANALSKKWGGRVGQVDISAPTKEHGYPPLEGVTPPPSTQTAHYLPLTPQARDALLHEGQPLFSRRAGTVAGAVTPERAARWLIRLFSTGDIGTAFHEGGHLLDLMMGEGWTRQAAKALGVPDTQIAAAFDRGDATATREIRERIAEGVRRVLRNRMRPGGRGSNLLRDFTDTLGDVWARVRGVPEVAPREFRAFWDAALRPDDHARPAAIALVDERVASREMRPPVFAPDDPAAEVAAMPVLKAGQRREAGRVDAHPSNVLRAALGLKAGQATADPLELLANALAYAGTERARRTWGFGKTMALTTRVALPEKRAKQVLEDVDRHRRAALGGKDLRPTVVDGVEVMDLDADQQAGLARLVAEVQESPLGETLSERFDATERPNPAHAAWAAEADALRARLDAAERAKSPEWVAWRDRQFGRSEEQRGAAERLRSLQSNPRADDPEWADEVEALRERMLEMDRAPVEAEPPRAGPEADAARAALDAHMAARPPETLSGVDLGRVTVEDYNSLMAHLVEIRSGAGAFREREAERAAASGALRLWGKAVETVERTDLAPMVNWLKDRFVASHAEDRYLSPAKRDVIYSVKRELGEVGKDLRREGRAIEGAMRRSGVKDFTAVDILRRASEGMPPEVVPVEMLDELASLAGGLGNPTIERVAQRADDLHRLFTGARISSATQTADEVASLAVLDQVGRRRANGMPLEMALDDLGLTLAKTEDAMSIVMEGLRRRVHAVDDAASDILVGFAGSPDRAVLTGIQNKADRRKILHRVYGAWYSGRWDEILVQTTRKGQAAAGPRFDQGAAAATVLLRLKARRILGTLARRMAEAGVLGDMSDVARPGLSFDRAYTLGALEGGREAYIRSVAGYIEAITGWKDTPTIVLPRDGGTPEIHPAPGRRTADGREDLPAYMDAMRFLNQWGFRTGKGTWATLDIPGGSVVMVPELTRKPIEEVVNAAAPSGMAWRLGGDKLGDVTRAASEAAPPTVTTRAINAAVAAIRGTYDYTLGMTRAGLTTGLLLPNPAFYVGNLIGGAFQLYQGMGAAGALSIMARPLMPTEDGAAIRRVLARMWADGSGALGYDILRPAERGFFAKGGQWWSDAAVAQEATRAGLNSSLPKSEAMDSIIRDLKRMEPGWFNAIMRAPRAWQRGLVEAATAIDNYYRVATFVDGLRRGRSATEAAEKARSVAFDYNALTDFEKQRIRPVVMFYSFMRRNQDLFWRTLLENPSRVMGQLRMLRGLQQQEIGEDAPLFVPDYMDGRAVLTFRKALADGRAENEGRGMALLSPRLPVGDAVGFWLELMGLAEMDPEAGRDLLNRLDPMIKAPIVLGTNTDLLTGREVDAYNTVPNWLVEMDRNATGGMLVDDIFQVRPAQWRDAMSEGYPGAPRYQTANGKMWWLYRNLLQTPGAGRSTDTITAMQRADLGESVIGEHGAVQGLVDLTRWFAAQRGETPTTTEPDTETARPWLTEREETLGLLGIRPQRIEERDQVIARLVQERAREVAREEGRVRATREHRYGR